MEKRENWGEDRKYGRKSGQRKRGDHAGSERKGGHEKTNGKLASSNMSSVYGPAMVH